MDRGTVSHTGWLARLGLYLAGGLAAVAGSFIVRGTEGFVVTALAPHVLRFVPDEIVIWGILTIGSLGTPVLVVTALAVATILFGAVLAAGVHGVRAAGAPPALAAPVVGIAHAGLAYAITGAPLPALGAGLLGGGFVWFGGQTVRDPDRIPGRRHLLAGFAGAFGALLLGAASERVTRHEPDEPVTDQQVLSLLEAAEERSLDLPGTEPLVSNDFYNVDIATSPPRVDVDAWRLEVTGHVDRELSIPYDDLRSRPAEHRFITLRCVSDPVDGELMDNALWTGIPMAQVLEEAGAPTECCVRLEADDGYFQAFSRAELESGFLAWRMNGRRLPYDHGYPVRVLIPGHWGEINVKWLREVRIIDEPDVGYWERRGWQGTGEVNTIAKLSSISRTDDGRLRVGGHAYAGTRGIDRVEVSIDDGRTWTEATLSEPLPGPTPADGRTGPAGQAADAWRMWTLTYDAATPHEATVRAVDGEGTLQPSTPSRPFPSGSTGWDSRLIRLGAE